MNDTQASSDHDFKGAFFIHFFQRFDHTNKGLNLQQLRSFVMTSKSQHSSSHPERFHPDLMLPWLIPMLTLQPHRRGTKAALLEHLLQMPIATKPQTPRNPCPPVRNPAAPRANHQQSKQMPQRNLSQHVHFIHIPPPSQLKIWPQ